MSRASDTSRPDLYSRVTNAIIADLETGVRPWTKPWSAEHLAGRITRPLRSTGEPYSGINVVLLWAESVAQGYTAPIWITFRQALALGGHVRKGEKGSRRSTPTASSAPKPATAVRASSAPSPSWRPTHDVIAAVASCSCASREEWSDFCAPPVGKPMHTSVGLDVSLKENCSLRRQRR